MCAPEVDTNVLRTYEDIFSNWPMKAVSLAVKLVEHVSEDKLERPANWLSSALTNIRKDLNLYVPPRSL